MRFKELLLRLTGISTPVFGVSWNPPTSAVTVARSVLAFLEDRRVLYVPSEMETPEHCVRSVLDIRQFLTRTLGDLAEDEPIVPHLRAMRAACRKFLETVEAGDPRVVPFGAHHGHWASWVFQGALGEMRGVFGIHVAALAAMHGLAMESGLASILPAEDAGE